MDSHQYPPLKPSKYTVFSMQDVFVLIGTQTVRSEPNMSKKEGRRRAEDSAKDHHRHNSGNLEKHQNRKENARHVKGRHPPGMRIEAVQLRPADNQDTGILPTGGRAEPDHPRDYAPMWPIPPTSAHKATHEMAYDRPYFIQIPHSHSRYAFCSCSATLLL